MLQAGILGAAPQKPLAAWAKQLGLGDDLRTLHAILEEEASRREAHPRGCSRGVMSLDRTAAKFKLSECAQVIGAPSSIRVLKRSV